MSDYICSILLFYRILFSIKFSNTTHIWFFFFWFFFFCFLIFDFCFMLFWYIFVFDILYVAVDVALRILKYTNIVVEQILEIVTKMLSCLHNLNYRISFNQSDLTFLAMCNCMIQFIMIAIILTILAIVIIIIIIIIIVLLLIVLLSLYCRIFHHY